MLKNLNRPQNLSEDIKQISKQSLLIAEDILRPLVNKTKKQGDELLMLNPLRNDQNLGSFKVNLRTGHWSDFSTGDVGGDLVSLVAYLIGEKQSDAARFITENYGIDSNLNHYKQTKYIPSKQSPNVIDFQYSKVGKLENFYIYKDANNNIVSCSARYVKSDNTKDVRPWVWSDEYKKWICRGLPQYPLYNLRELITRPNAPALFVEGEKTAEAASKLFPDFVVVTNFGGSKAWQKTDWSYLFNRTVVIWPDNDSAGRKLASNVAQALNNNGSLVGIVDVPEQWEKGWDLADPFPVGITETHLLDMLKSAYERCNIPNDDFDEEFRKWPKLESEALHGFAGRFSKQAVTNSEADIVAVLVTFLVSVGICIDRKIHFFIGDGQHHSRLFALIVGKTGRSRKGTSEAPVHRLFEKTHELLSASRVNDYRELAIQRGLATGEGLAHAIRDESDSDNGVSDKRLLIIESEFAQILKQAKRTGNIINPTLRNAWDGKQIGSLTKTDKAVCKKPHVGIVGHVTQEELHAELSDTDIANGFLNRFIITCVRRSKQIALPEPMDDETIDRFSRELVEILNHTKKLNRLHFSQDAKEFWEVIYPEITRERHGKINNLAGRAEAHILRLSMIYAILDQADNIQVQHIRSGYSLWMYAEDSMKYIFETREERVLSKHIEKLENALQSGPLKRTEVRDLFSGHKSKNEIDEILKNMAEDGKITITKQASTGGRPAEIISLCDHYI